MSYGRQVNPTEIAQIEREKDATLVKPLQRPRPYLPPTEAEIDALVESEIVTSQRHGEYADRFIAGAVVLVVGALFYATWLNIGLWSLALPFIPVVTYLLGWLVLAIERRLS